MKQDQMLQKNLRMMTRGAYDLQKLRVQTGLRLVATLKLKMGQEPGEKEEDADIEKEAMKVLVNVRKDMALISEWAAKNVTSIKPKNFKGEGLISSYTEYQLALNYLALEKQEECQFKAIEAVLDGFPIYTEFLKDVRGCGTAMSAMIISEFDIYKARYPSSMWKYAGLDVAPDGQGRSRRAEHLVDVEYENKAGDVTTRKSITYNPMLKTKLVGVLGSGMLKAGIRNQKDGDNKVVLIDGQKQQVYLSKYAKIYVDYKNRLDNRPDLKDESKGHRHNMAVRYMVKMFILDLYKVWRELEGLEVAPPYHVAKLGLRDHAA